MVLDRELEDKVNVLCGGDRQQYQLSGAEDAPEHDARADRHIDKTEWVEVLEHVLLYVVQAVQREKFDVFPRVLAIEALIQLKVTSLDMLVDHVRDVHAPDLLGNEVIVLVLDRIPQCCEVFPQPRQQNIVSLVALKAWLLFVCFIFH